MNEQFLDDVRTGLTSSPKSLSSKYFYDREGDKLFQQIMALEEYYLTDCEHEIFSVHKQELLDHFTSSCELFHLIEFGAGDAFKTKILISHFLDNNASFEYNPIDISNNVIISLERDLNMQFPGLHLAPINMEYFAAVEEISKKDTCKKIILFLGSNIGNFSMDAAHDFFSQLGSKLQPGDQAFIGFDLRKDPEIIHAAYNDSSGITAEFNLNLLKRINRELQADFNIESFYHYPVYDPAMGAARSYLISRCEQIVAIGAIPMQIMFAAGEPIYMEISQKYNLEEIQDFANSAGFLLKENYFDKKHYFVNSLWEKV